MASTATNYLTILGSGFESEPSCCITTRSERILFNCPEGTQRAMTEHKLKLTNKMRNIFFTRGDWNLVTGITDVVLKAAEEGQQSLKLVGPQIREYVLSTSYFLGQRPQMSLKLHTLPLTGTVPPAMQQIQLEDGTTIDVILLDDEGRCAATSTLTDHDGSVGASSSGLRKNLRTENEGETSSQQKRMRTNDGASVAVDTATDGSAQDAAAEHEQAAARTGHAEVMALPRSVAALEGEEAAAQGGISELCLSYSPYHRRPHSLRRQEATASQDKRGGSVCYVVTFPPLPGKFDAKAADALGVKGALRRDLIQGKSVTLGDGTVVEPHQCVGAGQPGGVALVVDCRSEAQAERLLRGRGEGWAALERVYRAGAGGEGVGPVCAVHMGPGEVVGGAAYREWMGRLPAGPGHCHSVLDPALPAQRPLFAASERYLKLLHAIDAGFFPLSHAPYHQLLRHGAASAAEHAAAPHPTLAGAVCGWPLQRFVFPPHKRPGIDAAVPDTAMLHYYCLQGCICPPTGAGPEEWEGRQSTLPEAQGGAPAGGAVCKVVFLGTGASAPFKYRTVSGILLFFADGSTAILDAGDGTYGTLVRKYGVEGAGEVVRRLKFVWVSHKHADHISGVAGLLLQRQKVLASEGGGGVQQPAAEGGAGEGGGGEGAACRCGVCGAEFAYESSWEMHHRAVHPRHRMSRRGGAAPGEKGRAGAGAGGEKELVVVGPMWLDAWLRALRKLERLQYEFIECQELAGAASGYSHDRISALLGGSVRAVLVQHSFPSYGFVMDAAGFKLVYSGDTRPCDALVEAGADADLLIHEATFDDDMQDKAQSDRHSTVREALGVAERMRARHTILTHFSSRFEKLLPDLKAYGKLGETVACAVDGMEVAVARLRELPAVSLQMAETLLEQYGEQA